MHSLKKGKDRIRKGEMAERSNAAVLKTVLVKANGGSNPSFSANQMLKTAHRRFFLCPMPNFLKCNFKKFGVGIKTLIVDKFNI